MRGWQQEWWGSWRDCCQKDHEEGREDAEEEERARCEKQQKDSSGEQSVREFANIKTNLQGNLNTLTYILLKTC